MAAGYREKGRWLGVRQDLAQPSGGIQCSTYNKYLDSLAHSINRIPLSGQNETSRAG